MARRSRGSAGAARPLIPRHRARTAGRQRRGPREGRGSRRWGGGVSPSPKYKGKYINHGSGKFLCAFWDLLFVVGWFCFFLQKGKKVLWAGR